MFGLFENKKKAKLERKYAQLLDQAHRLSQSSRKQSDLKMLEAEQVLQAIKQLEAASTQK